MKEPVWITTPPLQVAAQPLWHPVEKRLYFSDVVLGKFFRYNPADGSSETLLADGRPIGAMVLQADGSILLFRDSANVVSFKDGKIEDTVIFAISDYKQTRYAAAAADPFGRIVCAVISDSRHTGRLLLLDRNRRLTLIDDGFGVPAGIAFSKDGKTLYFSDSHGTHKTIWQYSYSSPDVRDISKSGRVFHSCLDDGIAWPGAPAGLAALDDGSLLVAKRDGAMVVRYDVGGNPVSSVRISVRKPTGLCFGGDEMKDLFITTSSGHRKQLEGLHSGELAVIGGCEKGVCSFLSKIGLPDEIPQEISETVAVVSDDVGVADELPVPKSSQEVQPEVVDVADPAKEAADATMVVEKTSKEVAEEIPAQVEGFASPAEGIQKSEPIPGSTGSFVSL